MVSAKGVVLLSISLSTVFYTFYVMANFVVFLSKPKPVPISTKWVYNLLDLKSRFEVALGPLAKDIFFTQLFIVQHSLMKSRYVKAVFEKLNIIYMERSFYCLMTSVCLQKLVQEWEPTNSMALWKFDVSDLAAVWWLFVLLHVIAWYHILAGCIIMDLPELLGIKQVYYHICGYGSPLNYKSCDLNRLYLHMRHPSVLALGLILWTTNIMSLDRFVLALLLTIYIFCAWTADMDDIHYGVIQRLRKKRELRYRLTAARCK